MNDYVVGIDLGRTKIALGLVDAENQIVARRRLPTRSEEGPGSVVERIAQMVGELQAGLPGEARRHPVLFPVAALGICAPGPVDHERGMILDPHLMDGLHHTPLAALLAERLGVPVVLDHDAKAAALGEFHYGAGRGERSMIYVVVGTGVGAALILDGQIMRGLHNFAGEVGHITLDRQGEACACGSRGCVETYMSGPWLERRYRQAQEAAGTAGGAEHVSGEQVTELARRGDPIARQVLTQAGEALGTAVATMAMILNVDLYVIGGSVVKAGELVLAPARAAMPRYSFPSVSAQVRIAASTMGEDAPILGCSWLARQLIPQS